MKTINETRLAGPAASARAYTLIELLTVIAIIGALAAMIFPVLSVVKKKEYINAASAEFRGLQHALEDYHAKYNTYPPSNPSLLPGINTLYYELTGVSQTTNNSIVCFSTLDGVTSIPISDYQAAFSAGIGAVFNCTQGGDEGSSAKNYLSGALKANRFGTVAIGNGSITNLITSVGGPDASYLPLGALAPAGMNPFCYNFPGTNNPSSYDLWIDLKISGKTNRICNWKSAPFIL
jgi:prepilin-type N-terminal cleavage/methylation domain-containing protein